MQNLNKYLQFFKLSQQLKFLKRTGWTRFQKIEEVESVADHSWMISLICLSLPAKIDKGLCVKIALLHDLAEVVVGDITPLENVPKLVKKQMEDEAFKNMVKDLDPDVTQELHDIYQEYESGTSEEAKIVRDLDKYEMMLQAYQYELKYPEVNLEEFFSAADIIKTDLVKQMLQDLMQERRVHHSKQDKYINEELLNN